VTGLRAARWRWAELSVGLARWVLPDREPLASGRARAVRWSGTERSVVPGMGIYRASYLFYFSSTGSEMSHLCSKVRDVGVEYALFT